MQIKKQSDIRVFNPNPAKWQNKAEKIVLHHTAFLKSIKTKQFFSVNEWHKQRKFNKKSLGYHVGYNFIIEGDGTIMQGRAVGEELAAHRGSNTKFLAVSFSGDYRFETLSKEQLEAYKNLHLWLEDIIGHKLPITAHREISLSSTVCPAKNVQEKEVEEYVRDKDGDDEKLPKFELIAKIRHILTLLMDMIKILTRNS